MSREVFILLSEAGWGFGGSALKALFGVGIALILTVGFSLSSLFAVFTLYLPDSARVTVATPTPLTTPPIPSPEDRSEGSQIGSRIIEEALRYLGFPYVWGGASPETSFDCSGLTQWVYGQVGIGLPRVAQAQYDSTRRVQRAELKPGDLVFFENTYYSPGEPITHVGVYIGGGQMINAPSEGHSISIQPVFTGFWGDHYAGGGRVGGE